VDHAFGGAFTVRVLLFITRSPIIDGVSPKHVHVSPQRGSGSPQRFEVSPREALSSPQALFSNLKFRLEERQQYKDFINSEEKDSKGFFHNLMSLTNLTLCGCMFAFICF
jgi:hypothetical protein